MAIMRLQLVAIAFNQALTVKVLRNRRRLIERRPALLIRHLEEEQKRQLLDVVAIRQPVIAQDVAVVPKFLNELGGLISHEKTGGTLRRYSRSEISVSQRFLHGFFLMY